MYITNCKTTDFSQNIKNNTSLETSKLFINEIINECYIMPSEFIFGLNSETCSTTSISQSIIESAQIPPHIQSTILTKQSNAGFECILNAVQLLSYQQQKTAALCMTFQKCNEQECSEQNCSKIFNQEDVENTQHLAGRYEISQEEQEAYATTSYNRYKTLCPTFAHDKENIRKENINKPNIYANRSSGISAALVSNRKISDACVKIIGFAKYSSPRHAASTSAIFATAKLLHATKLHPNDIQLFEIHELCAMTPIAYARTFSINLEKINIYGGACAYGDASSLTPIYNLINGLYAQNKRFGIATTSNIFGESIAIALEVS